jgi:hypothetical protein
MKIVTGFLIATIVADALGAVCATIWYERVYLPRISAL